MNLTNQSQMAKWHYCSILNDFALPTYFLQDSLPKGTRDYFIRKSIKCPWLSSTVATTPEFCVTRRLHTPVTELAELCASETRVPRRARQVVLWNRLSPFLAFLAKPVHRLPLTAYHSTIWLIDETLTSDLRLLIYDLWNRLLPCP